MAADLPLGRSGSRGFTLLEVMVALAILGLALSAILSAQAGLYNANVQARNVSVAGTAARCKMHEVEEKLLKEGYPELDQSEEGPCCAGDSPAGVSCRWQVERVELPNPPATDPLASLSGGDAGSGGGGLGPLGALAQAAASPSSLADGGIGALSGALSQPTGPNGQTGVAGVAGMAMQIVYPQLKPLLEASIRRVTVDVLWNEGPNQRSLRIVQFVTNPQRGLPPVVAADPAASGLPGAGAAGAATGGAKLGTPVTAGPTGLGGIK